MKRICVYIDNEPLGKQGGMERVTHHLAEMLRDAGYNTLLLCRVKNRLGEEYQPPVPLEFMPGGLTKTEEQTWFIDYLKRNKVEVLIDQTEGGIIGRWGIFRHRRQLPVKNLKLIAVQHNSQLTFLRYYKLIQSRKFSFCWVTWLYNECFLRIKKWRAYLLQKSLFKDLSINYDNIVTLSHGGIDEFVLICPTVDRDKLVCIPNAIRMIEPPDLSIKEKRCLYVGRLDNKAKGVDRLLRIWKMVEQHNVDWQLDIVGDGPDGKWLQSYANELELRRVTFHGFQEPISFYRRASIFCMTSTYEGFGMVLVEAMQHGCVPIAFDSYPAARYIIMNDKTGCIVESFNENDYAQKLEALMSSSFLATSLQNAAYTRTLSFASCKTLSRWKEIID